MLKEEKGARDAISASPPGEPEKESGPPGAGPCGPHLTAPAARSLAGASGAGIAIPAAVVDPPAAEIMANLELDPVDVEAAARVCERLLVPGKQGVLDALVRAGSRDDEPWDGARHRTPWQRAERSRRRPC